MDFLFLEIIFLGQPYPIALIVLKINVDTQVRVVEPCRVFTHGVPTRTLTLLNLCA